MSLNVPEAEREAFLEGARLSRAWMADMKARGRDIPDSLLKQGIPYDSIKDAVNMLIMMRRAAIFHDRTRITKVSQIEHHPGELEYS